MSNVNTILKFLLLAFLTFTLGSAQALVDFDEWEGDISSDWNNANNWEGNSFPTTSQAARIDPSNYTNAPVMTSASSFTPRFFVLQNSGTCTTSGNLTVGRSFWIAGGSTWNITSGTIINNGTGGFLGGNDLNIRNEDTKVNVSGGTLTVNDDVLIDRFLDLVPGADPTLNVTGGYVQVNDDIRFDGIFSEQPKLIVNGGTVNVDGSVYNDGADVNIFILSDSLIIGDDLTMNGTDDSLTMTGGVIYFRDAPNLVTDNLTVDGTFDGSAGGTVVVDEDLDVDGTGSPTFNHVIVKSGATIDQIVTTLNVTGDWTNNGTFAPRTNTVIFNGSVDQNILGGGSSFENLTINNAGGNVVLQSDIDVDGALTLTAGLIMSDSTNTLTINDNATTNGGNASSYVDSYMRKVGNDNFIFPLGNGGNWMRLEISSATGTALTDVFEAEYLRGTHPQAFWDSLSYGGNPGGMYNVSILDYWKLYRTNGTAQPFVKLYWQSGDSAQITDLTDLVVAHYTGSSTWENLGGTTAGSVATGTVSTSARVNNFSPFTFGSSSATSNPLPITLLEFKAESAGDVVHVFWTTIEEINNDYFTIERSVDGKNFHEVDRVDGAGNNSGLLSYSFIDENPIVNRYSYYRLKQTDFDGTESYSNVDAVYMSKTAVSKIVVFPNPVTGNRVFVNLPNSSDEVVEVFIFDQLGNQIKHSKVRSDSDGLLNVDVPVVKGLYILKILTPITAYTSKLQVK